MTRWVICQIACVLGPYVILTKQNVLKRDTTIIETATDKTDVNSKKKFKEKQRSLSKQKRRRNVTAMKYANKIIFFLLSFRSFVRWVCTLIRLVCRSIGRLAVLLYDLCVRKRYVTCTFLFSIDGINMCFVALLSFGRTTALYLYYA